MRACPAGAVRREPTPVTIAFLLASLLGTLAEAREAPARPDTEVGRLEAWAAMQTLNAEILASPSATLVLESWCRTHALAAEPRIVAVRIDAPRKPPSAEQLERLQVASAEEIAYRRVELTCGERVLSKADNWYVPARLTADMNRTLATTDTPFGKVVAPLAPFRKTLGMQVLWTPAATACDHGDAPLPIPDELFQHRAVLYTSALQPFSEVSEVYQGALLAFAPETPADASTCGGE